MNVNRKTFNSLPVEIIKKILCYANRKDLFNCKTVCSFWNNIIHGILNIQEIPSSPDDQSSIKRFSRDAVLKIYRASRSIQDLIDEKVISDQTGSHVFRMKCFDFPEIIRMLLHATVAFDSSLRTSDTNKILEILQGVISAMIGLNCELFGYPYPVRGSVEKFVRTKFRWYIFAAFCRPNDDIDKPSV